MSAIKFFRAISRYRVGGDQYEVEGARVDLSESMGLVSLDLVKAGEPGSGRAAVARQIANRTEATLTGNVDPRPTRRGHIRSVKKLTEWYAAQGFRATNRTLLYPA